MFTLVYLRTHTTRKVLMIVIGLLIVTSSLSAGQQAAAKGFIGAISPVWSPDGQRIAFLQSRPAGTDGSTSDLYLIKPDGSGAVKLMSGILYNPRWSPDGKQIVVEHMYPDAGQNIESGLDVVNLASDTAITLTKDGYNASWSTDGKQLYFLHTNGKLYVVNGDGSGLRAALPDTMLPIVTYAWSPDGKRLAFVNQPDPQNSNNFVFYIADANGLGVRQIDTGALTALAWSPDSRQLATISHCGGQYSLCLFNADGSSMHSLVKDSASPSWSSYLAWSPNGQSIAYIHLDHIELIGPDGSSRSTLISTVATDPNTNVFSPTWSPDSQHLVFQAQYVLTRISGEPLAISELYTINANGMNLILLQGLDTLP